MEFENKIKKICEEHKKVGLFVDMDGTVAEYTIYDEGVITNKTKGLFLKSRPIKTVIKVLENLNKIENLDIYILTLSKSTIIKEEKKQWLKKHMPFIKEENYIIVVRETGEYSAETRTLIKCRKMQEHLDNYDYIMMLDDEHKILRATKKELGVTGEVFHISSALV